MVQKHVVRVVMGGFSGGTIQSFIHYMKERIRDPVLAKLVSHPYALIPEFPDMTHRQAEALPDKGGEWGPQWSEAAQQWGGPFVMHFHNEKIVRMSNALLQWKLGARSPRCTWAGGVACAVQGSTCSAVQCNKVVAFACR